MKINKETSLPQITPEETNLILQYMNGLQDNPSLDVEYISLPIPFAKSGMDNIRKFVKDILKSEDENCDKAINYVLTNILTSSYIYLFSYSMSCYLSVNSESEDQRNKSIEAIQFIVENLNAFKGLGKIIQSGSKVTN